MIRKQALDRLKGFDTSIPFYGEDTQTAVRLSKIGKVLLDRNLWIETSGRRFKQQGVAKTMYLYLVNHFSVNILKAPIHRRYNNYR